MIRFPLRLLAALALVALTAFVVACGGDDGGSDGSASKKGAPTEGKKGGKLEVLSASDVDFLDPGQTYFTGGYEVAYVTQRPLYSFKPGEVKEAVPDLAEADPEIAEDKKSVSVTLKEGVKFGPPVNREIQRTSAKQFPRTSSTTPGARLPHAFRHLRTRRCAEAGRGCTR